MAPMGASSSATPIDDRRHARSARPRALWLPSTDGVRTGLMWLAFLEGGCGAVLKPSSLPRGGVPTAVSSERPTEPDRRAPRIDSDPRVFSPRTEAGRNWSLKEGRKGSGAEVHC